MIKFCIVAAPRSGTSYLTTALDSCPMVLCHGEIFHSLVSDHIAAEYANALDLELRELDPMAFVDRLYALGSGTHAAGFKIFRGHNDIALSCILLDREIKKIVLQRENVLASYSSLLIAEKTGHWQYRTGQPGPQTRGLHHSGHEHCGAEPPNPAPGNSIDRRVMFDPAAFVSHWDWYRETYDYYRTAVTASGDIWLDVDYLTLTSGDFSSIERFLELPVGCVKESDIRQLNTKCILDRFRNPDDVRKFARSRNIEHWLQE